MACWAVECDDSEEVGKTGRRASRAKFQRKQRTRALAATILPRGLWQSLLSALPFCQLGHELHPAHRKGWFIRSIYHSTIYYVCYNLDLHFYRTGRDGCLQLLAEHLPHCRTTTLIISFLDHVQSTPTCRARKVCMGTLTCYAPCVWLKILIFAFVVQSRRRSNTTTGYPTAIHSSRRCATGRLDHDVQVQHQSGWRPGGMDSCRLYPLRMESGRLAVAHDRP